MALPVVSPTCAASSLALGRASDDVGFELGLGDFESAKARTGYVRRVMGVWRAIDGWGAGRMARHLEAVRRDMRGGIAGCVVELTILREAQNYSESWLMALGPSNSGITYLGLVLRGNGRDAKTFRGSVHSDKW